MNLSETDIERVARRVADLLREPSADTTSSAVTGDDLIPLQEAGRLLGLQKSSVYKLCDLGYLERQKICGRVLVKRATLDRTLQLMRSGELQSIRKAAPVNGDAA